MKIWHGAGLAMRLGKVPLVCSLALGGAAAPLGGCSSDPLVEPGEGIGSLGVRLEAAPGVTLKSVTYTISGNGFTKTGTIDTSGSPAIAATIGGIPAGNAYTITLFASSVETGATFTGSANFDVTAGNATEVTVHLRGQGQSGNGSVIVNGTLNIGPVIEELTVAPLTVYVGSEITLQAIASDPDSGPSPLSYTWTTTGGKLRDANEASASLWADAPGEVTVTLTVSDGDASTTASANVTFASIARRIGPVITSDLLPGNDGGNIAGPSPIATPDGLRLYFADHRGTYIRLAFADDPLGPWQVHAPGTLPLSVVLNEAERTTTPGRPDNGPKHIASPDVHLLEDGRWRIYFHARPGDPYIPWRHENGVATSVDGIDWHLENPKPVQGIYLRGFRWNGEWYGVLREGALVHSVDGVHWDDPAVSEFADSVNEGNQRYIRHVALAVDGDELSVYYSRIGDAPERIMLAKAKLAGPWTEWRLGEPVEVLRPEEDWEGADLPVTPSRVGDAVEPGNELRDPGILDYEGRRYLYYSYRGERGIGIAEITHR